MKTRRKNLKNKEAKKRTKIERIVKSIIIDIEVIPEEKDREILLEKLRNSTACIALGRFQHAVIVRIKSERIKGILKGKLVKINKIKSNENKQYIFITSTRYKIETLERVIKGIVNKIKLEQERDCVRSLILSWH